MTQNISMVVRGGITIIGDLVVCFILCWQLTLAAIVGVGFSSTIMICFHSKQIAI